jgi:adenosylcobinamide-phosphate synthase
VNISLGGGASPAVFAANGAPAMPSDSRKIPTESTAGQTPELAHLTVIVGLVWRTVVMWMVLLALLTLARLLG